MAHVDAYYISELEKELLNIYNKNLSINDILGEIGERFVKDGIKYYFFSKGFKVRKTGERTFKISGQYKVRKSGVGGIDFRLQYIHRGKRYDCYVEVMTREGFENEILPPAGIEVEIDPEKMN